MMAETIETVVESSYNEVKSVMAKKSEKATPERIQQIMEYNREHNIKIGCYLNRSRDGDLLNYWRSIPNKSEWLRERIREQMKKEAGE